MSELVKDIRAVNIEDELQRSYLDYAMSVIVGRALPDVRDGLKPVHRRVLFAMNMLNNDWNKPHKKSARVVGDVIGKYHPHGDTAVYDTIVRMAQTFSMRYMLVDGQGNFGSVDGDMAAAMRYTEVRLSKIAHSLMEDLDKETVDFAPNYDETEFAPTVLPTRIPNLLINGVSGIAVGMATNIPPHNLGEVVDGCIALVDNPDATLEQLIAIIPGPDFPTAGIINGRSGILDAYATGRGRIYVRARTNFEELESNKTAIIVTELPYQVNKARVIEKIAELVKDKKIDGIVALRDESDKDGMRIYIELRRNELPEVVLNNLYAQTQMQSVFGINMVALVDGQPRTLDLKSLLTLFIRHRREVVNRRTIFELRKARERAHTLEGLGIALSNIDEMIALIKSAKTPQDAKVAMLERPWKAGGVLSLLAQGDVTMSRPETLPVEFGLHGELYHLSPEQAQAILELRLHRLTGLEQDKILAEYKELIDEITELLSILNSVEKLMSVIRQEFVDIRAQFADARRTEIVAAQHDLSRADLITEELMVVTLSNSGYVKSTPLDTYQAQRRGGRGKSGATVRESDFVKRLLVANTHDTILCFSSRGKVYWLRVYELPVGGRTSTGRPIVNLLPLGEGETISAILPLRNLEEAKYIFMATRQGTVKKVELSEFSRPRSTGLIALDFHENDELIGVHTTTGTQDIMLFTDAGKAIRFNEDEVRAMGRTARGVRGIRIFEGQKVISLVVAAPEKALLVATENGYGKRTDIEEFPMRGRGGQGVIAIQTSARNGKVVSAVQVTSEDEIMLITDGGTLIRTRCSEISTVGRNTQGVSLIRLSEGEKLIGLERVDEIDAQATSTSEGSDEDVVDAVETMDDADVAVNDPVDNDDDHLDDVDADDDSDKDNDDA